MKIVLLSLNESTVKSIINVISMFVNGNIKNALALLVILLNLYTKKCVTFTQWKSSNCWKHQNQTYIDHFVYLFAKLFLVYG